MILKDTCVDCVIGYIKCYKYKYFIEFTKLVAQIIGKINEKDS